jgi:hypothetical protein
MAFTFLAVSDMPSLNAPVVTRSLNPQTAKASKHPKTGCFRAKPFQHRKNIKKRLFCGFPKSGTSKMTLFCLPGKSRVRCRRLLCHSSKSGMAQVTLFCQSPKSGMTQVMLFGHSLKSGMIKMTLFCQSPEWGMTKKSVFPIHPADCAHQSPVLPSLLKT